MTIESMVSNFNRALLRAAWLPSGSLSQNQRCKLPQPRYDAVAVVHLVAQYLHRQIFLMAMAFDYL